MCPDPGSGETGLGFRFIKPDAGLRHGVVFTLGNVNLGLKPPFLPQAWWRSEGLPRGKAQKLAAGATSSEGCKAFGFEEFGFEALGFTISDLSHQQLGIAGLGLWARGP